MPTGEAFDLYSNPNAMAPTSRKKVSRWHPRESSSDPSKKKAQADNPPAPTPSRDMTPPPAPVDLTPPAPRNPIPSAQSGKTQVEAIMNIAYNSATDRLKKLSRRQHSLEAFSNASTMKGVLTMSTSFRHSEEMVAEHFEEIKTVEERLTEQLKVVEAKHAEQLRAADEKIAKLGEELKQHQETLVKVTEAEEKYKEASVLNFKEASKLQDDLVISRKETTEQEERVKQLKKTNARDLERFKGAAFNCFYMLWKSNPEAKFDYFPEHMKQAKLAKCITRLEEEEKTQGSLEISLATGIEGIEEDAKTTVDQQPQQDPPAAPATQ
ncbi:uncharacterized protein LOC133800164 [Humulus lupulus]|uniref:uncharacterized protein LOC133800164 n=1 Tax=Humulus lupulus TaxID=3486 RepID=UPI002B410E3F|nr:uncharacterized protein LOC133800164 [Humulus lupulus]